MNKFLMAMALTVAAVAIPVSAQAYVGVGVGVATTDTEHTSYKLLAGFQPLPILGFEIAYSNFGDFRGARADSYSLAAVGTLPLGDSFGIFGKLGSTENHTNFAGTTNNRELLKGFGIVFKTAPDVSVRIEYEDFGKLMGDAYGVNTTVTNWGLNLKASF